MRYHGNKICADERTNGRMNAGDRHSEYTMPSVTLSGDERITSFNDIVVILTVSHQVIRGERQHVLCFFLFSIYVHVV